MESQIRSCSRLPPHSPKAIFANGVLCIVLELPWLWLSAWIQVLDLQKLDPQLGVLLSSCVTPGMLLNIPPPHFSLYMVGIAIASTPGLF